MTYTKTTTARSRSALLHSGRTPGRASELASGRSTPEHHDNRHTDGEGSGAHRHGAHRRRRGPAAKCSFCGKAEAGQRSSSPVPGCTSADSASTSATRSSRGTAPTTTTSNDGSFPNRRSPGVLESCNHRPGHRQAAPWPWRFNHYKAQLRAGEGRNHGSQLAKSNILCSCPTGCGETTWPSPQNITVPFAIADATALSRPVTSAGSNILKLIRAADYDVSAPRPASSTSTGRQDRPQSENRRHRERLRRGRSASIAEDPRAAGIGAAAGRPQAPRRGSSGSTRPMCCSSSAVRSRASTRSSPTAHRQTRGLGLVPGDKAEIICPGPQPPKVLPGV